MPLSQPRAADFAARLDLSLDGICLACLSFVSQPVVQGDLAATRTWVRRMTPDAAEALEELESRGPRSGVAREIVLALAEKLARWEERQRSVVARARPRLPPARPDLN